MKYNILIVDDERANLRVLERLLADEYTVITADSGAAALDLLTDHRIEMIITDQRMPGMTGIEFLKRAEAVAPHAVRMIITGYTDVDALVDAVNSRIVYKYITKPWINSDLKLTISRGLQHFEAQQAQRNLQENYTSLLLELDEARVGLTRFCAAMLQLQDPAGHVRAERVSKTASVLAGELELSFAEREKLQFAIYARYLLSAQDCELIFNQAGNFDDALSAVNKIEAGMRVLSVTPYLKSLVSEIHYFGERFDGSGYPNHLFGASIPLIARVAAVLFEYDEMLFPHDDLQTKSPEDAVKVISEAAGTRFDPRIVEIFRKTILDRSLTPLAPMEHMAGNTQSAMILA